MDEPLNVESSIPENKHLTAACDQCNRQTRHKVLAQTHVHWEYGDGEADNWIDYQIIQCRGCLSISFCEESLCSADVMYGEENPPVERRLFPNRIVGRSVMEGAQQLPENVYGIYEEAHNALCAELLVMAGFGVRAIVEAVCKDKGITGRNLKIKIDGLAEAGLITSSGATILQHLRLMGNAAAHEMKLHAQFQLSAAFDVIEYLLQGVYILPRQAELLPKPTANSNQNLD
ncbi:DUF4145 domain-containing protein [Paraburkholderia megapolitana]|uniref:DUF4145 domain-containing protein n=1 Tax=Paraburkholderia megapolitana TaxID=420953 RepID=A0A1I3UP42_9BURK|nr:DUF4145 domain-containing protein [Paraburkholderia megapolitana]QDQ82313.1 DUF4145 domain-containing protein [Paraburkholderia megapolitana]SFJ85154.1 protein of unknown function [Paraburkholderia megapolitana]